jgi:hypothetical protein
MYLSMHTMIPIPSALIIPPSPVMDSCPCPPLSPLSVFPPIYPQGEGREGKGVEGLMARDD